jgi:hypothetical protein
MCSRLSQEENVPFSTFDQATNDLLCRVYDAVWQELEAAGSLAVTLPLKAEAKARLTRRLIAAANSGERDFEELKAFGLRSFDRAHWHATD